MSVFGAVLLQSETAIRAVREIVVVYSVRDIAAAIGVDVDRSVSAAQFGALRHGFDVRSALVG